VKLTAIAAAIAVIVVPMAVQGTQAPTTAPQEKRVCEINLPTGSRLGGVRRCRTKAEREQAKQEARTIVERIQAMKPTICTPQTPC
jgi:hypothetical protein